jgi:hypothetical protein
MTTFLEALKAAHEAATPEPWRRADPNPEEDEEWGHDRGHDIEGPVPEGEQFPASVISSWGYDADSVARGALGTRLSLSWQEIPCVYAGLPLLENCGSCLGCKARALV